jgi:putative ABC transport system permease protein
MLRNYLLIAIRTLRKNPGYTFLNIFGLVLGFACSLIILLFVNDELTYDKYHANIDNIHRLQCTYYLPNDAGKEDYVVMGAAVAQFMVSDYPEIFQSVRFQRRNDKVVLHNDGTQFYETLYYADSNVFDLFTFPLVEGDAASALTTPYQVVLSQEYAIKYFGSTDVVGESLELPEDSVILNVAGVLAPIPSNSHLKFDMLASFETLYSQAPGSVSSWWSFSTWTYLEIDPKADIGLLSDKIIRISANYILEQEEGSGYYQEYYLQRMDEIHLNSDLRGEMESNSKATNVYIFLLIGVFILLIACINFMNLATARSANRAREIGVRKVSGAHRSQLVNQFLSESILISTISMIIALILAMLILPSVNDFTGKELSISFLKNQWLLPVVLGTTLIVGLLSGSYPAFFLSGFKPSETLKGSFKSSSKGNLLRQILVVSQFAIGIFLIACTVTVYKQLDFLRNKSLGFEKERILFIPTRYANNTINDFNVLKNEVEQLADIESASLSSRVPGKEMGNNVVRLGWDQSAEWSDMRFITVDHDFMDLYELETIEGRAFDEDYTSDENEGFLLNESGMNRLGWTDPEDAIGKELRWQNRQGRIIGIVKDFHFMSANQSIQPFIMVMNGNRTPGYMSIKMKTENFERSLGAIESTFKATIPGKIFEYEFLDTYFDQQYKAEEKFMSIFTIFTIIAICVACLGLYGLAAYIAETKNKEIGVRKVLGASVLSILVLLNRGFTNLVLVSILIATPLSYFAVGKWMSTFPYQTSIAWWIFLLAGFLALLIAWATVSYQSARAARINPVETIANE